MGRVVALWSSSQDRTFGFFCVQKPDRRVLAAIGRVFEVLWFRVLGFSGWVFVRSLRLWD